MSITNAQVSICDWKFYRLRHRAMFTGELAESRQTEVVIRDIDERAMELLIDFAYTSQVTRAWIQSPCYELALLVSHSG